jgi:hypothetical protein
VQPYMRSANAGPSAPNAVTRTVTEPVPVLCDVRILYEKFVDPVLAPNFVSPEKVVVAVLLLNEASGPTATLNVDVPVSVLWEKAAGASASTPIATANTILCFIVCSFPFVVNAFVVYWYWSKGTDG